jgi:hypothetical protein
MLLLTLTLTQVTPPALPPPPTLPPVVAFARVESGMIHVKKYVGIPEQRRVLLTKTTPDGKTVEEPTLVIETMPYVEQKLLPLKDAKATNVAGQPLPTDKVAELLKTESVVVLVPGENLEARYRKAFRDDVVVLSVPPERQPVK